MATSSANGTARLVRGRHTKIVCTIGPASNNRETIRRLIDAGADVFRLNFSHGTHADHQAAITAIRDIGYELSRPFAIFGDLSGPKLRISEVEGGAAEVRTGQTIVLTSDPGVGAGDRFPVNFKGFHNVAKAGHKVLLDDGNLELVVREINGRDVLCTVVEGGLLKSRKGVNLPDTKLPIPALTEKDRADMAFALKAGVDMLALSFVRSPLDIVQAQQAMDECGRRVPLLAKIEKREATENLEAILRLADGAMVARGDLGIEMPMQEVPTIQKRIIRMANKLAKPVITATQMLESMITNPRATRAEVADIYNAILDGTDAVMLSGETAAGAHPIEAVEVMDTVAAEAEKMIAWNKDLAWVLDEGESPTPTQVICNAAVRIAEQLRLDLIVVPTQTGFSAYHLSRFKPKVPIFACSTETNTVNPLCLAWGVTSRLMPHLDQAEVAKSETDALISQSIRSAQDRGFIAAGQRALIVGGLPLGKARHVNFLRVVELQ